MIKKISGVVLFLFLLIGVLYAQDSMDQSDRPSQRGQEDQGGERNGSPRVPPQSAIDACVGKSEGTACEVSTPEGGKAGDCAYTPDKKYFACRPNRMSSDRGGSASEIQRERPDNPQGQQKNNNQQSQDQQPKSEGHGNQYTLEQAMSDNAQLSTIAFSGLAFITGSGGADTFFPPGKVADFFGFQYMRDVDTAGYGHNTTFLTRVASNVLHILNDSQKAKLVALAKEQLPPFQICF